MCSMCLCVFLYFLSILSYFRSMKPIAFLLLAWALCPLASISQTQNPKWKTEWSVRTMGSRMWFKDYGFNFIGLESKTGFSFGLQGGKSLQLAPGWRLFFGLGYTQFGFRSEVDFAAGIRINDPNDQVYLELLDRRPKYTLSDRFHLLDAPVRLDFHTDSTTEKGWVFGLGLTPSLLFGRSWNSSNGRFRSSGTEFFSPEEGFLSAEVQAGRVWSLGKGYALDTRLLIFGDPYRFRNRTTNRVGVGLQVGFRW